MASPSAIGGVLPLLTDGGASLNAAHNANANDKSTDPGNEYVIPSRPLGGFLGETSIAGQKVGLHMTTRGVIGAGYVGLGIGLAIVGLVFIIGGLDETKTLVRSFSKGI